MTATPMIYCKRLRAKMSRVACERRKSRSYRANDGTFPECRGCPGPELIGEMNLEDIVVDMKAAEARGLCVECGERSWNPKYSRLKICGVCMAKRRKPRTKPRLATAPFDPGPAIKKLSEPKTAKPEASELTTPERLESFPMGSFESLEKGGEICAFLEKHGISYQVEVKIFILPEGRQS